MKTPTAALTPVLPPDDELIDVNDVARIRKCKPRTVYRHADAGLMPWGVKTGGLRRWRKSEILAWIAGGCRPVRSGGAAR